MNRADYYQEAFECAMSDEGLWHLVEQMTAEQRANVGGALEGAAENVGLAFHTPENPYRAENDRLKRKVKWQGELEVCSTCHGDGRLRYNSGPWAIDTGCDDCGQTGKIHPRNELEPHV